MEKVIIYIFDDPLHPKVPSHVGHRFYYYNKAGMVTSISPVYKIHEITDAELMHWASTQKELEE